MKTIAFIAALLAASAAQAQTGGAPAPAAEKKIEVQGHRGSRGTHPENTLPAFEEALRAGVDVLEFDMGVTKDGVVIVSHDPNVNPVICLGPDGKKLDKPVPIISLTLEELKKYDCGSLKNPRFPEQVPVPGTRIPTLDEVFAMVKASKAPAAGRVGFNIETKIFPYEPSLTPSPDRFAELVAAAVRRNGVEKRAVVQSFDARTLKALKKIAPEIRTAQLTYEELLDVLPALKAAGTDVWSPYFKWLTPEAVAEARAAGVPVVPWTLNEPKEWEFAVSLGVDAIITDYPARLIAWLKEKKLR